MLRGSHRSPFAVGDIGRGSAFSRLVQEDKQGSSSAPQRLSFLLRSCRENPLLSGIVRRNEIGQREPCRPVGQDRRAGISGDARDGSTCSDAMASGPGRNVGCESACRFVLAQLQVDAHQVDAQEGVAEK